MLGTKLLALADIDQINFYVAIARNDEINIRYEMMTTFAVPKLRELYIYATCPWRYASCDHSYLFELMKSRPGMVVGSTFPTRLHQFDVLSVHAI